MAVALKDLSMKCLRKFISVAAIAAIAVVPLLSAGCNSQPGGATSDSQTVSAPSKVDTTPPPAQPVKKPKKDRKKPTTSPESGSTTGAGVTPPVK